MAIRTVRPEEHADFLDFCNAGMRPAGAATRVADDFPVIFSRRNLQGLWGLRDEQGWAAGLAVLVRDLTTGSGTIRVAGIGSVVTRPDRRGEGLSSRIQSRVLDDLAERGVPLAVLWTDRPEIYAGRGFAAAGREHHLDLSGADLRQRPPPGATVRPAAAADHAAVARLYGGHPLRTLRERGDDELLYGMPGTRGLVLALGDEILAYAYCGKGEDFPGYVAEWGGPVDHVLTVMAAARRLGLASRVLVPAGCDDFLAAALERGAAAEALPSGLWKVLRPDLLPGADPSRPETMNEDPCRWLGEPPRRGRLDLAVWGLDSV